MVSITAKGPIIFLRLSENLRGQYDGMIYPATIPLDKSYHNFYDYGYYLNYTKFKELTDD